MVGWHHRLNGHEFEQIQGDSRGQGRLSAEELMMLLNCGVGEDSCKSPLDCKEIKPVNPQGNQC